jgi:hypothetical protein
MASINQPSGFRGRRGRRTTPTIGNAEKITPSPASDTCPLVTPNPTSTV